MKISEAAKAAGVGVETIRFYERKGLVPQPRRPVLGGFRSYTREAVERIRFIRKAQGIGFSLKEIKDLLSLRIDPNADCGEVRAHARAKLDEVNKKIASLNHMKAALEELIEACPGEGALGECSILEALAGSQFDEAPAGKAKRRTRTTG
ncbi:MAG: heavy metal-responsive transcriptional regulator [Sphingomonadales bacterium]